jgi:putative oxidoreductase
MPNSNTSTLRSWGLMPLRLAVGAVFLAHGGQKLFVFGLAGTADIMSKIGIPLATVAAAVVITVECLGGVAIVAGLMTRWAAALLAIDMTVAILAARIQGGFFTPYGYEFEMTLLGACITLALVGAGGVSVDSMLSKRAPHA